VKNFSWISFSVALLMAAVAGIIASNFNFFSPEEDKTLRSYLMKASEDPQFSASMSKTFQTTYEEKGISLTQEQIRLTNECIKTAIDNQLINSKDISIKTHLDEEYEIKSTADWKKLFNSEIMDKYKNTLSRITRSCQALNIEDEITQDSVNKSLVKENNVKGLLCGKDDYYLIDVKNEKVKHSSSKRVDWTGMIEEEKTTGYRWWNTDPNTISFWFGYVEGNKYLPAYKYTINRKTLSLKVDYCADMDNFVEQLACFSPNPQIIKCEAFTSEKLLMKWENEIRKRTEDNKI